MKREGLAERIDRAATLARPLDMMAELAVARALCEDWIEWYEEFRAQLEAWNYAETLNRGRPVAIPASRRHTRRLPALPRRADAGWPIGRRRRAGERHGSAEPVDPPASKKWFQLAEAKAEIPHVKGRGWRGVRCEAVDEAKRQGISREGLMQHGGWTDTQVPDAIYPDQEAEYARAEAAAVRAKIRGESV